MESRYNRDSRYNRELKREKRSNFIKKTIIITLIILAIAFAFIKPLVTVSMKKIEYINSKVPQAFDGYKILQISDLYLKPTDDLSKFTERINNSRPNAVVFTGNIFTVEDDDLYKNLQDFKESIDSDILVYISKGQTELAMDQEYLDKLYKALELKGMYLLDNRRVSVIHKGSLINLYGLTPNQESYNVDSDDHDLPVLPDLLEKNLSIVLSNNPIYFKNLSKAKADIVLSGARSGGWIRLPIIGGLNYDVDSIYKDSLYGYENSRMIVSRGSGTRDGNIRIFNPRIINELILKTN